MEEVQSAHKRCGSSQDLPKSKAPRLTLRPEAGSPLLIGFPEEGYDLYKPDGTRICKPSEHDVSGYRFLANCGKWFLVVDSHLKLYIIDLFSDTNKIHLPPLESVQVSFFNLKRTNDTEFMLYTDTGHPGGSLTADHLRGVLWVNEDNKQELEYLVVWRFDECHFIGFCKNGYEQHLGTPTHPGPSRKKIHKELVGFLHMVLKRDTLYILSRYCYIRTLDFSGQFGFKEVPQVYMHPMNPPDVLIEAVKLISKSNPLDKVCKFISNAKTIAVTGSGDVLLICTFAWEDYNSTKRRIFRLFKRDPNQDPNLEGRLLEVDSLGDEALFLDLGVTVPADETLGIEPNCIYFTRDDRLCSKEHKCLDIFVYNLATKTFKRFQSLSTLNLKDALWFIPS